MTISIHATPSCHPNRLGLRREAQRHAAFGPPTAFANHNTPGEKAVSPLRFAPALQNRGLFTQCPPANKTVLGRAVGARKVFYGSVYMGRCPMLVGNGPWGLSGHGATGNETRRPGCLKIESAGDSVNIE
jgi:hypothetical protein